MLTIHLFRGPVSEQCVCDPGWEDSTSVMGQRCNLCCDLKCVFEECRNLYRPRNPDFKKCICEDGYGGKLCDERILDNATQTVTIEIQLGIS